jgi:hypothetical protein
LKKHKSWFDEDFSELLHERKLAKLWWLQAPLKINKYNLNSVKCEASSHFKNKKRGYLKDRINVYIATNSKNKTSETCLEE